MNNKTFFMLYEGFFILNKVLFMLRKGFFILYKVFFMLRKDFFILHKVFFADPDPEVFGEALGREVLKR